MPDIRLIVVAAILMAMTGVANAGNGNHMPARGTAPAPFGFAGFCNMHPAECTIRSGSLPTVPTPRGRGVKMSPALWEQVRSINLAVNQSVREVADQTIHGQPDVWSFPVNGRGDCEDFALLKRKKLIEAGWPSSALLITAVRTWLGEGHAVLTVVTSDGDFILDNRTNTLKRWNATFYRFFARQSQSNPRQWVWVTKPSAMETAALGGGAIRGN